jgi:hypothetical protein
MSGVENLLLFTALHASEADRRLVAAIMCCKGDAERTAMFNFHLAERKGEAFLSQHGRTLAALQVPLFPDINEYDLLNTKLLREYANPSAVGAVPLPDYRGGKSDERRDSCSTWTWMHATTAFPIHKKQDSNAKKNGTHCAHFRQGRDGACVSDRGSHGS